LNSAELDVAEAGLVDIGTIVRFDRAQGYGFIAPDDGGDDVFFHASLLDDNVKDLVLRGIRVEYRATASDRGPKAVVARLLGTPDSHPDRVARDDDDLCEVIPATEYAQVLTDILIEAVPTVTGAQITQVRKRLVDYAKRYGWVEA
jgi:cold shock CspA family protein